MGFKRVAAVLVAVFACVATLTPSQKRFSEPQTLLQVSQNARPLRVFEDERLLLHSGAAAQQATLRELVALGVGVVRVQVTWREFEPTRAGDSAAHWAPLDALVAGAVARGLRPLLTLTSPAPSWGAGSVASFHSVRPDAAAFGRFVAAVGHRYNGRRHPRVELWALWNEPNNPEFLMPQRARSGQLLAPAILRTLLRAGAAALRRTGHARDTLLVGEWLPLGTDDACAQCTQKPLDFARELLCLDSRDRPLGGAAARRHVGCAGRFAQLPGTGWSVHPYTTSGNPAQPSATSADIAPNALGRLRALLDRAARAGRVRRGMQIWETEDGVQTNPPDPYFGVPPVAQARYLNEAEWFAWRQRYVASFAQYALQDDAVLSGFQSGLVFADGRPKPSLDAYRLPLVVLRAAPRSPRAQVWMRVPPAQPWVTVLPPSGAALKILVPRGAVYIVRRVRSPWRAGGQWRLRLADGTLSRPSGELLG